MKQAKNSSSAKPLPSTRSLVIQPLPGIGDALWHLRAFRAIARQSPSGKITLLAKKKSQVDKLLAHEPWIEDILWLDEKKHFGRMGSLTLGRELKAEHFGEVWILHHSPRYYIASSFAGISKRHGYGFGWLKGMLSDSHVLEKKHRLLHPIARYETFFDLHKVPLKSEDRFLTARPDLVGKVNKCLKSYEKPWIVMGFGATNPKRIWPPERFVELALELQKDQPRTIFLSGAKDEDRAGQWIQSQIYERGGSAQLITDFDLGETCALLDQCDLFIGNDSGLLNLAGSLNKNALGLFGNLGVREYTQEIFNQVLAMERDRKSGGMADLHVKDVMDAIKS